MDPRAVRWMVAMTGLAVALNLGFILYSNAAKVGEALAQLKWYWLAGALLLSLGAYLVRGLRWIYYLQRLDVTLDLRQGMLLYFAGLSMLITPAMVSGVVKVGLVKVRLGVELSRTLPIVVVERLTDLVGLLVLAVLGVYFFGLGFVSMAGVVLFLVVVVALVRVASFRQAVLRATGRVPGLRRHQDQLRSLLGSAHTLLDGPALAVGSLYGLASWGLVGLALYLLILGLDLPLNLPQAFFVFAFPAILGIMSQLPGGLGLEEGGMLTLLTMVQDMELASATALVILFRLVTLWFGLIVGLAALAGYTRQLDPGPSEPETSQPGGG